MGEEARGLDAQPPTIIHDVPHDLLERILLRVRTPVSLIRAAATCKPWCRVIAGGGFLRRFRRLNGPHILGRHYYYGDGIRPVFVPLAAPEGKPAIDPARVSLDFLRSSYHRIPVLQDSRDGLLAFYLPFSVIICNPLTKQHRQISMPLAHHLVCNRQDLSSIASACSCSTSRWALTCQTSGFYGCV